MPVCAHCRYRNKASAATRNSDSDLWGRGPDSPFRLHNPILLAVDHVAEHRCKNTSAVVLSISSFMISWKWCAYSFDEARACIPLRSLARVRTTPRRSGSSKDLIVSEPPTFMG